uniref:Uncharacterized protein n=1 Tax=Romanomermis culicivorax TaxID=13658 RepID=A0A915KWB8_ROMCU
MQATSKVVGFVDSAFQNDNEDPSFGEDHEEEDGDVYDHSLENNFRYNRTTLNSFVFYLRMNRINGILGLLCIILSVLGFSIGIWKLDSRRTFITSSPHRRTQMYVETNFSVLLLFYAGIDALVKFFTGHFFKRSTVSYCILFLAVGHQITGLLAQLVNLGLSVQESDIFVSIFVSITQLVGGPTCICLVIVHIQLQKMSNVASPPISQLRKSTILILLIFVQLMLSFSAGILFLKNETDHDKSLKIIDEIGSSFWVIFSASICLILVMFHGKVNFLDKSALILEFVALLLITKEWPIYKQTYFWQTVIFVASSSILTIGFFRRRLYLTNFTPLSFFIFIHLIVSVKLYKNPSPVCFALNSILVILCGVFSFRDVYLFNYHVAKIGKNSPDLPIFDNSSDQISSFKTGLLSENDIIILNVGLVVATLMELLLCISLLAAYLRTVFEFFRFSCKTSRIPMKNPKICAVCQLFISAFLLIFGFAIFVNDSYIAEIYGDHSIYLAIFSILASILTIAIKKSLNFVPFALTCQSLAFFQKIQFLDFGAFCLRNLRDRKNVDLFSTLVDETGRKSDPNATTLATLSFVLLIVECFLEFLNVILLNDIFESGNYGLKPQPFILS